MQKGNRSLDEIIRLMQQAAIARVAGHRKRALEFLNSAIQVGEYMGVDVTRSRRRQQMLSQDETDDIRGLTKAIEEDLAQFVQRDNLFAMIDMLVNLVGGLYRAGQYNRALRYLDETEDLIGSLTSGQIEHMNRQIPQASLLSAESFLHLRLAEIRHIRKAIAAE
jgi:hypothetical protein